MATRSVFSLTVKAVAGTALAFAGWQVWPDGGPDLVPQVALVAVLAAFGAFMFRVRAFDAP